MTRHASEEDAYPLGCRPASEEVRFPPAFPRCAVHGSALESGWSANDYMLTSVSRISEHSTRNRRRAGPCCGAAGCRHNHGDGLYRARAPYSPAKKPGLISMSWSPSNTGLVSIVLAPNMCPVSIWLAGGCWQTPPI